MGKSPRDYVLPDVVVNEINPDEKPEDLPIGEYQFTKKGVRKIQANEDTFGYNPHALKIYMAMAGYKANFSGLQLALGCSHAQAVTRMIYGKFTRHDIAVLTYRLKLSPQQAMEIWFNGHYQRDITDPEIIRARAEKYDNTDKKGGYDARDLRKPRGLNKDLLKNQPRKLR